MRRRGQANTEFIIVVALIAIATIGIITLFGDNIRGLFGNSADNLAGDETDNNSQKSDPIYTDKTMSNFAQAGAYDPLQSRGGGGTGTSTGGGGAAVSQ